MIAALTNLENWIEAVFNKAASLEGVNLKVVREGIKATKNDLYRILKEESSDDQIKSAVNKTSTIVRSLLTKIGEAQVELCGNEITASNRRILRENLGNEKYDLLEALKRELIALALYIERVYAAYHQSPPLGCERQMYLGYLMEKKHVSSDIRSRLEKNKTDVEVMLADGAFDKIRIYIDRAKEIVNELAGNLSKFDAERRSEALLQIQALENLKCLRHFFPAEEGTLSVQGLLDPELTDQKVSELSDRLKISVYQNEAQNKPLHALAEQEQLLHELVKTSLNIEENRYEQSIPRRLLRWLGTERITIEQNLHLTEEQQKRLNFVKIKTDLSVEELAGLFRLLMEENIIKVSKKTDLVRTVIATFSSKIVDDNTYKSFMNKFNDSYEYACRQWHPRFQRLVSRTRPN